MFATLVSILVGVVVSVLFVMVVKRAVRLAEQKRVNEAIVTLLVGSFGFLIVALAFRL